MSKMTAIRRKAALKAWKTMRTNAWKKEHPRARQRKPKAKAKAKAGKVVTIHAKPTSAPGPKHPAAPARKAA